MGQFQWIRHRSKEILFGEFNGGYESDALRWPDLLIQDISGRKDGSVLLLAELGAAGYSPRLAVEWQKHQELLHFKCLKIAALRAKGIISIAAATFLNVAKAACFEIGHKVRFFENMEMAQNWLVQDEKAKEAEKIYLLKDAEATE